MLNVHRNSISALVNNNRNLATNMAVRLARSFDTTIEFWLNLQLNVDIWEIQHDKRMQADHRQIITALYGRLAACLSPLKPKREWSRLINVNVSLHHDVGGANSSVLRATAVRYAIRG